MQALVKIKTTIIKQALEYFDRVNDDDFSLDLVEGDDTETELDLVKVPEEFLTALHRINSDVYNTCLNALDSLKPESVETALETMVSNLVELQWTLQALDNGEPVVTVSLGKKRYPIPFNSRFTSTFFGGRIVLGGINLRVCDRNHYTRWGWSSTSFQNDRGNVISKRVVDLLKEAGLKVATKDEIAEFKKNLELSQALKFQNKTIHNVTSTVLEHADYFFHSKLSVRTLGSEKNPRKLILEHELEREEDDDYEDDDTYALPFVRGFSLDLKKYVYADVNDVKQHTFDKTANDRIVLPGEMHSMLNRVFDAEQDDIFGDMFGNRHGGIIILANGTSGVGKTLTAEVFAEYTERPLYVLEMGELGTDLNNIERNLMRIFARATRWNAILLFDECEVFLARRADDLERNAIVGVFLRLLDHYDGTMFLTTNRADVIDDAFKSRITLKIDYPQLDVDARAKVWKRLLTTAKFEVTDEITRAVAGEKVNGRQIRNMTRLLRIVKGNNNLVEEKDIRDLMKFCAR